MKIFYHNKTIKEKHKKAIIITIILIFPTGCQLINGGELSAELTVIVGINTLGNKSTPTSNRVSSPRKTIILKGQGNS